MLLSCAAWQYRWSKDLCGWAFAPTGYVIAASALEGTRAESSALSRAQARPCEAAAKVKVR
jgi:hypothetical protein